VSDLERATLGVGADPIGLKMIPLTSSVPVTIAAHLITPWVLKEEEG
jgi:hypothetical protein